MLITDIEMQSIEALSARQAQLEIVGRHIDEYKRLFIEIKGGMIRDRLFKMANTKMVQDNGSN